MTEEEDLDVRERIIREKLDNEPPTDLPEYPFKVGIGTDEENRVLTDGGGRKEEKTEPKTLTVSQTTGRNFIAIDHNGNERFGHKLTINGRGFEIKQAGINAVIPYDEVTVRNHTIEVTIHE